MESFPFEEQRIYVVLFTLHLWLFQHMWVQNPSFGQIPDSDKSYRFAGIACGSKREKKTVKPSSNNIFRLIRTSGLGKERKANKVRTRLDMLVVKIHKVVFTALLFHVENYLLGLAGPNSAQIYGHAGSQNLSGKPFVPEESCSSTVSLKCTCRLKSVVVLLYPYARR